MAKDINATMKETRQRRQITMTDPVTVISLAREGLYELAPDDAQRSTPQFWALEEVLTRFEQASRAHAGAGSYQTSQP